MATVLLAPGMMTQPAVRLTLALFALHVSAATVETVALPSFSFYEENIGQADPVIRLLMRNGLRNAEFTATTIRLYSSSGFAEVRFAAAGSTPAIRSIEAWPGVVNRFEGPPANWRRNIPAHRRVQLRNVYPGVDLTLGDSAGQPTFAYSVQPGVDLATVVLDAGTAAGRLTEAGGWRVEAGFGSWVFGNPKAFQENGAVRTPVGVSYAAVTNSQVRFQAGNYDRTRPLFIDLEVSGERGEFVTGASVTGVDGSVYLAGFVSSAAVCRVTTGGSLELCPDAFVAGVTPEGRPSFYTVLAGRANDFASRLVIDQGEELVVAGVTSSEDFPVTAGALQRVNAGPTGPRPALPVDWGELFIARISVRGGDLSYSTFLGGPRGESLLDMAIGPDSSITVLTFAGPGFPTTPGAWIPACDGCPEATAVARLAAGGSRLLFSTYVPGALNRLAVHSDGTTYLAGDARTRVPVSQGALQPELRGFSDAYIVRLASDGSGPIFATYYGGEGSDGASSLAADPNGDVWVSGSGSAEAGTDFRRWPSFLVRLSADGSRLLNTQLTTGDGNTELRTDRDGKLLLYSQVLIPNLPTTPNALFPGGCGNINGNPFLLRFRPDGSLDTATYLPGAYQFPQPIGVDSAGRFLRYTVSGLERVDLDAPSTLRLGCVTSAASRYNFSRVSPGTIVTLIGTRMGPQEGVAANPENGRFPTTLAGVRVRIGGIAAPLLFVRADQINAVTPYGVTPGGKVDVVVEYGGGTTVLPELEVVPGDFALFSTDGSGFGQAAALNEDGSLNSFENPAAPGSIIVLYGTGIGATLPASADGALAPLQNVPKPVLPVGVLFDSAFADVYYAGPAPGAVNGLVQINVRLPANLPPGPTAINVVLAGSQFVSPATVAIR